MIRKVIFMAFALLFVVSLACADSSFDSGDNVVILGNYAGGEGKTPPTLVQKVYVTAHGTLGTSVHGRGANVNTNDHDADTGVEPGDVMVWDTAQSDGYSVEYCSYDQGAGRATNDNATQRTFAGVMVTRVSRDTGTLSSPSGSGSNVGYMAVRGFCQAKLDVSLSVKGEMLILNGETLESSFCTTDSGAGRVRTSQDIGCLIDALRGADTLHHVVLR